MKTTRLIALAAALVLSSLSSAHAQESSVQITKPSRYHLAASDFGDFKNAYELTNGQILKFTQSGNLFYAQLDKGQRVRIFAVSPTAFVTDAGTRISFTEQGQTVGISNFEKLPMAAKLPANTMMMARR
nr:gel scht [uncultured Duganella sp.]